MSAISYENQSANLCCSVSRNPVWYDFHAVMKPIRYKVNMLSQVLRKFENFLTGLWVSKDLFLIKNV